MSNNKWIKLDGKKDPPANAALAIWIPVENDNVKEYWERGLLLRIEFQTDGSKKYIFSQDNNEVDNATHYMIIEGPKEK